MANVAFLGTDDLGRDILSRLLIGTKSTFGSAIIVTFAATVVGLVLGCLAGMSHGIKSAILNHILDTLLSIPSLLLAIIVVAFVGASLEHAMLAIWLALIPEWFERYILQCMMNWIKNILSPHDWTAHLISIFCGIPYYQILRLS